MVHLVDPPLRIQEEVRPLPSASQPAQFTKEQACSQYSHFKNLSFINIPSFLLNVYIYIYHYD
jgi:hypothetical protein